MISQTETMRTTWLNVDNLNISYGSHIILKRIAFSIGFGETVGIIGKNGTGKSTLLNALLGMGVHTTGSIRISGVQNIVYIPQHHRIVPNLTVNDHLRLAGWLNRAGMISNISDLISRRPFTRLASLQSRKAAYLSGGEQFLLALACAYANNDKIDAFFLDEPTAGLDIENTNEIHELLSFLKKSRETVIVMAEQNLSTVLRFADRIFLTYGSGTGFCTIKELSLEECNAIAAYTNGGDVAQKHLGLLQQVGLQ